MAYQLDLMTPGISPFKAMLRKQMRQMPNLRKKARGRPHKGQRWYFCTLNLGVRFALAINDFLAMPVSAGNGAARPRLLSVGTGSPRPCRFIS